MKNTKPVLPVCFLWHMHQPLYKNPKDGHYLLPWVRLHAIKDYLDMALLIESTPGMKAVFNMVPSLLVQIQEYARRLAKDRFLLCSQMPSGQLSEDDKMFLLKNFFMVNRERRIASSFRYRELLRKRGGEASPTPEASRGYTIQDFLDLQVHFNLAWCGPSLRKNADIAALIKKDSGFTEEEKKRLLAKQERALRQIIPVMRRLQQSGQIEISFSPFFHPILPLLCDTDEAQRARPGTCLPENRFRFPEDAEEQIRMAKEFYENLWGCSPQGMWPSEGAVSNLVLDAAIRQNIKWVATDQGILHKSLTPKGSAPLPLAPEDLYSVYGYQNSEGHLSIFFRNQILSDLIGFTYSSWDEEQAASDFYVKLLGEKRRLIDSRGDGCILSIIMDGENAWEHYPEGGEIFLSTLYRKIVESEEIRPLTFTEFLKEQKKSPSRIIPSIWPGTWIDADFSTWIGEKAKNRAWDRLFQARKTLQEWLDALSPLQKQKEKETIEKAMRNIYAAEGSDWFWWLRNGERPPQERLFDVLMNLYLAQMYETIRIDAPFRIKNVQGDRD